MACFHDSPKFEINDEYMTRKSAWEDIKEYIPTDKVIWECFYGDGKSGQYSRELGFEVIHEPIDFFENDKGDILISNPPFSNKDKVKNNYKFMMMHKYFFSTLINYIYENNK